MPELDVLVGGLTFLESPRWHDGRLWFSEFYRPRVLAVDLDGRLETVAEVPNQPSGLGWLPDGRLLVVSMRDRRLLRLDGDELVEVADLSGVATWHANDMVVDGNGRAYIGHFGFDTHGGAAYRPAHLIRVDPDGAVGVAADDLAFPNGAAFTADGRTLVVAESRAHRLTAFTVGADGTLSGRRVWADLPGTRPDGICLDAESAAWVADADGNHLLRVREGAGVVDRIDLGRRRAYACALGGPDGRTLFLCSAYDHRPDVVTADPAGAILTTRVDVPAADAA